MIARAGAARLAVPRQQRPSVDRTTVREMRWRLQTDHYATSVRLGELEEAVVALRAAETRVHDLAVQARRVGATWQQLGDVLGMTAKSAWKRYVR